MNRSLSILAAGLTALVLQACAATGAAERETVLNSVCPRSGKPVAADSLTTYRGHVVGFCNPHCRDDFAAHVAERPEDRAFFDRLLESVGHVGH